MTDLGILLAHAFIVYSMEPGPDFRVDQRNMMSSLKCSSVDHAVSFRLPTPFMSQLVHNFFSWPLPFLVSVFTLG